MRPLYGLAFSIVNVILRAVVTSHIVSIFHPLVQIIICMEVFVGRKFCSFHVQTFAIGKRGDDDNLMTFSDNFG